MKTLEELDSHAAAALPDGGIGHTVPLPILEGDALRAAVLAYPRSWDPSKPPLFYPPHLLLVLDVETAEVRSMMPLAPGDLLPAPPDGEPLPSTNRPRAASVEDWLDKRARLGALVPAVWSAFAEGRVHLSAEELLSLAQALSISEGTEPDALVPYLRVVARDFYAWAKAILIAERSTP